MTDKFCGECGAALIESYTGKYDVKTGRKAIYQHCPTSECGHYGIEHKWEKLDFEGRIMYLKCKK